MRKAIRQQIADRSGGVCEWCFVQRATQIHHIKKRSQGGTDELNNLMHLCVACHIGFHNEPALIKYTKDKTFEELRG